MAGLTQAEQQATLDARFPTSGATDHVGYSVNGSTEAANIARTPIGATGWAAATAATPSVKANANALTSAAATGSVGAVGYTAIFSALTSGTQRTDWQAVTTPKTVGTGDTITHAIGSIAVTLD